MKITFKQSHQIINLGDDITEEQLTEIFGFGKGDKDKLSKAQAERTALIKKYGATVGAQKHAIQQKQKDAQWAAAKAHAERGTPQDKVKKTDASAAGAKAREDDWVRSFSAR